MEDCDTRPKCPSAQPHGARIIQDFSAHYFGCIEIFERPHFFNKSNTLWVEELGLEEKRLRQQDGSNWDDKKNYRLAAEENITKKIRSVAESIESQYQRIETLRKAIKDSRCTHLTESQLSKFGGHRPDCNQVVCLEESYANWKQSEEFENGIKIIRRWKNQRGKRVNDESADDADNNRDAMDPGRIAARRIMQQTRKDAFKGDMETERYNLEKDISGYIIQWKILGDEGDKKVRNESQQFVESQPTSRFKCSSGRELYLKPTEEDITTDYRFKGHFPDQRLSLYHLLEDDPSLPQRHDVIMDKDRHVDRLRYIHIPHNNMALSASRPPSQNKKPDDFAPGVLERSAAWRQA
ncbi:hypothetical protein N0V92_006297 [Colletotrichum tropicale]|nr:hypothetical protein N0V92_006297 [Colletotrichum tropicale]